MLVRAYLGLGSRYSYLASTQLDGIAARTGASFEWVPLESPRLIRAARRDSSPFDAADPTGPYDPVYRDLDVRRWAAHYGVPYHAPDLSAVAPDAPSLACWAAPTPQDREARCRTIFERLFVHGCAVTDAWLRALDGAGSEPDRAARRHDAAIEMALANGAFGVPTFVVDGELFFGNDRLALLERRLG